ncbi:MAG: hypothetical protein D6B25_18890 [Desulfobulbaceae bacterium]|nr:MAG: hypothetical protein D6B25_18890 [Desulfobulbaceae bacterium]
MDDTFLTKTVIGVTGINRSKLDQWINRGVILPVVSSTRRGVPSRFNVENLVEILLIEDLATCGISLTESAKIAREVTSEKWRVNNQSSSKLYVSLNLNNPSERKFHYTRDFRSRWSITITISLTPYYSRVLERLRQGK